jgi:hypothetical protein
VHGANSCIKYSATMYNLLTFLMLIKIQMLTVNHTLDDNALMNSVAIYIQFLLGYMDPYLFIRELH